MRSRRNNTTLTRKVDKWNPAKCGSLSATPTATMPSTKKSAAVFFIPATREQPRRRSPRSSPAAENAKIPGSGRAN